MTHGDVGERVGFIGVSMEIIEKKMETTITEYILVFIWILWG